MKRREALIRLGVGAAGQVVGCRPSPRWASRILAPALGYMPTAATRNTELTERALHSLRTAKVL